MYENINTVVVKFYSSIDLKKNNIEHGSIPVELIILDDQNKLKVYKYI